MTKYLDIDSIYHGNSIDLIEKIKPESISLSFWSPPYFVGKEYEKDATFDSWQNMLQIIIKKHFLALKKGAFMVINIDDILAFPDSDMPRIQAPNKSKLRSPVTKEMITEVMLLYPEYKKNDLAKHFNCSEQTIDRRLRGNNIRGGKYSTQTKVKLIGHYLEKYAEAAGLYLYDRRIWVKDPTWQNSQWHSSSYRAVSEFEYLYVFWKPGETIIDREKIKAIEWAEWGSRGVWYIPSVRANRDHEAQFPLELASRVVRLYSSIGDIVLDPFMGSGTTAIAALQNERHYLGFEKEEKYVDLCKSKIQKYDSQLSILYS